MTINQFLEENCPNRIAPNVLKDIPRGGYMVYILLYAGTPIVVGHGKYNRARVIMDSLHDRPTSGHLKALLVRAYNLYRNPSLLKRHVVPCLSKENAAKLESEIHRQFGGDKPSVPEDMLANLISGLSPMAVMVIRMAFCSAFSAIDDLYRWRRAGLIVDEDWRGICSNLKLPC